MVFIVLNNSTKQAFFSILSLFTSIGTLLCCALPALLVTLGMGAVLAGFISMSPWITSIFNYKNYIFVIAGIMLSLSILMLWLNRNAPCPIDPMQARSCMKLRKISFYSIIFSTFIYLIGVFFAFFAADFL